MLKFQGSKKKNIKKKISRVDIIKFLRANKNYTFGLKKREFLKMSS